MPTTMYGDLNPEIAGAFASDILEAAAPQVIMGRFCQSETLPEQSTQLMNFIRYVPVDSEPDNLQLGEDVSSAGKKLESENIQMRCSLYGDHIKLTDTQLRMGFSHVRTWAGKIMSRQAVELSEKIVLNAIKAGTSVVYANGTARSAVNSVATSVHLNAVIEALVKANAPRVTSQKNPAKEYATEPVRASYMALLPPELIAGARALSGFIDARKYSTPSEFGSFEIGAYNDIRFLSHSLLTRFTDLGATGGTNVRQDATTSKAFVYPIIVLAEEAFAQVALGGDFAVTPYYVEPKPQVSDPNAQIGLVGWKSYRTAGILQDLYIARIETAAPSNI